MTERRPVDRLLNDQLRDIFRSIADEIAPRLRDLVRHQASAEMTAVVQFKSGRGLHIQIVVSGLDAVTTSNALAAPDAEGNA